MEIEMENGPKLGRGKKNGKKMAQKMDFEGVFHYFSIFWPFFCHLMIFPPAQLGAVFHFDFHFFFFHFRLVAVFHAIPARQDPNPRFSPKLLSLYFVGPRKSRKIPGKFPAKFPSKNQKKITEELLQDRIENLLGSKSSKNWKRVFRGQKKEKSVSGSTNPQSYESSRGGQWRFSDHESSFRVFEDFDPVGEGRQDSRDFQICLI